MIDTEKLGKAITEFRVLNKLTKKELAEKSGLSHHYISLIENGKITPSIHSLNIIGEAFGLESEVLLLLSTKNKFCPEKNAWLEDLLIIFRGKLRKEINDGRYKS